MNREKPREKFTEKFMQKKNNVLQKLKNQKSSEPKRMKKTIPTIFVTDESKENVSLIKKRDVECKNKKSGGVFVKVIKKNQIIMFISALCLVGVGYLAYNPMAETNFVSTTLDNSTLGDIGDATFVSSQKIVEEIEKSKEDTNNISKDTNSANNNNNSNGDSKNNRDGIANGSTNGSTNDSTNDSANDSTDDINSADKSEKNNNNVNSANTSNNAAQEKNESNYFINSKIDRDKMYSQMLESYQKILDNSSVSSEQKAIATQEISKINNQKNAIMIAENLIKNKGFEEVVIFINLDSISVVVKAQELSKEKIAQIQNIVTRELNVEIPNVNISTK